MKYAYNNQGLLRDVVMTHPSILFAPEYAAQFVEVPDDAENGWMWDGETASPPPPPPPVVPREITMRQARLVLLGAGLLDDIAPAIDALPSPQKEAAQIEWEYSNTMQRTNPLITALAPALNLTDAQIDQLFIQGATL
jgi:hypothetical protein